MTRQQHQDRVRRRHRRVAAITNALAAAWVALAVAVTALLLAHWWRSAPPAGALLVAQALGLALALGNAFWLAAYGRALPALRARARQRRGSDPLTGLLTRHALLEQAATRHGRARRRGQVMAMLVLDLDHVEAIHDLHGYAVRDALLHRIAADIVAALPPSALASRLGDDAFACAFAFDPADPGLVERVAEKLVTRIGKPVEVDGVKLHLSCSLGIARSDLHCAGIDALLRTADLATHQAKKAGKNGMAWFDPAMEQALQLRNATAGALRLAIPRQEVVPYFEQQVDLASGRLHGFEVLARWEHPEHGTTEPDRFIPVAEALGLIADLSLCVMRQAFQAARDWDPELTLSVNISPVQLRDAWLAQKIIKLLTETGFPASRLEVEITESALFDNLPLAQSIVGSLKNQGVRLALDDFGTGYSSLAHLRALPFDRIKIDKSFILSINQDADSAAIVHAIMRLGESLNLPITAEGVEDAAIAERLRVLGCARAQGWHYGRPMSAPSTRRLLAERRLLLQPGQQPLGSATTSQRQAG